MLIISHRFKSIIQILFPIKIQDDDEAQFVTVGDELAKVCAQPPLSRCHTLHISTASCFSIGQLWKLFIINFFSIEEEEMVKSLPIVQKHTQTK